MTRHFWVWLHRWVGLAIAVFLIIVGLTGSVLAFKVNFERLLTPEWFATKPYPAATPLDLASLADSAEKAEPKIRVGYFSVADDRATMMVNPRTNPATGKPFDVGFHAMYLNPWTGEVLGHDGKAQALHTQIIPFIYELHMNLVSGEIGTWILGMVALAWTLDTFYAIYLTFPPTLKYFFSRWKKSWRVKWSASPVRVNYDLHRASGLWLAPLLFIFAWSSVMFNLNGVYEWTTNRIFGSQQNAESIWLQTIHPSHPAEQPKLNWRQAMVKGQNYIDEIARRDGIVINKPFGMAYLPNPGVYNYQVESSIDVSRGIWIGGLSVSVDGETGELQQVSYPIEKNTVLATGTWLYILHFANFHDWLAYRILVFILGLVMTLLSITGVYIWWKKYRSRHKRNRKRQPITSTPYVAGDKSVTTTK
jgi:uncharacterized iron-regulated membrane protein